MLGSLMLEIAEERKGKLGARGNIPMLLVISKLSMIELLTGIGLAQSEIGHVDTYLGMQVVLIEEPNFRFKIYYQAEL